MVHGGASQGGTTTHVQGEVTIPVGEAEVREEETEKRRDAAMLVGEGW